MANAHSFNVGDTVRRKPEYCANSTRFKDSSKLYFVSAVSRIGINIGAENGGEWEASRFELALFDTIAPLPQDSVNVSDQVSDYVPNILPTTIMSSLQYFHTAVNTIDTIHQTTYVELVPYSVRQAKNANDMRDTLVRELPPEIETDSCAFLIKAIFN